MSFNHIKGQDKVVEQLKGFIKQSRLASSLLFVGPEGVGKKFTAITLAKAKNCLNNNFDDCDGCASCLKIDKSVHPDIHFIAEAADIKIDDIRALKRKAGLVPYEANSKVFIIDNAHTMTPEASNALLKILEEPTQKTMIILISHKQALLLKTIISRCQVIKFSPLPRNALKEILKNDYNVDVNFAHFLAYFSEGRLGYALKIKESDIFQDKDRTINEFCISESLRPQEPPEYTKEELKQKLNLLAVWFRDIYLVKAGLPIQEAINYDRRHDLLKSVNQYSFAALDAKLKTISDSLMYLEQNINTKLLLSNLSFSLKG
ncbi:MAG: DNA polymerase III subunit delta' [Candidatus Omnitrophota bacterium]